MGVEVVVVVGDTTLVTGDVTPVCVTPSDHVTSYGEAPVNVNVNVDELPKHIGDVPLNVAVGIAFTVNMVELVP